MSDPVHNKRPHDCTSLSLIHICIRRIFTSGENMQIKWKHQNKHRGVGSGAAIWTFWETVMWMVENLCRQTADTVDSVSFRGEYIRSLSASMLKVQGGLFVAPGAGGGNVMQITLPTAVNALQQQLIVTQITVCEQNCRCDAFPRLHLIFIHLEPVTICQLQNGKTELFGVRDGTKKQKVTWSLRSLRLQMTYHFSLSRNLNVSSCKSKHSHSTINWNIEPYATTTTTMYNTTSCTVQRYSKILVCVGRVRFIDLKQAKPNFSVS